MLCEAAALNCTCENPMLYPLHHAAKDHEIFPCKAMDGEILTHYIDVKYAQFKKKKQSNPILVKTCFEEDKLQSRDSHRSKKWDQNLATAVASGDWETIRWDGVVWRLRGCWGSER